MTDTMISVSQMSPDKLKKSLEDAFASLGEIRKKSKLLDGGEDISEDIDVAQEKILHVLSNLFKPSKLSVAYFKLENDNVKKFWVERDVSHWDNDGRPAIIEQDGIRVLEKGNFELISNPLSTTIPEYEFFSRSGMNLGLTVWS